MRDRGSLTMVTVELSGSKSPRVKLSGPMRAKTGPPIVCFDEKNEFGRSFQKKLTLLENRTLLDATSTLSAVHLRAS